VGLEQWLGGWASGLDVSLNGKWRQTELNEDK
jgi:hypothetical protein